MLMFYLTYRGVSWTELWRDHAWAEAHIYLPYCTECVWIVPGTITE